MNVCNLNRCVEDATARIIIETVDGVFATAACPEHLLDRIAEIGTAGVWDEVAEDCSIVPHVVVDVRAIEDDTHRVETF